MKTIFISIIIVTISLTTNCSAQGFNVSVEKLTKKYNKHERCWEKRAKRVFIKGLDNFEYVTECGDKKNDVKSCKLNYLPDVFASIRGRIDPSNIYSVLNSIKIDLFNSPDAIVLNEASQYVGGTSHNKYPKRIVSFQSNLGEHEIKILQFIIDFEPDLIITIKNSSFQEVLIKNNKAYVINDQYFAFHPTYLGNSEKYIPFEEFYLNNSVPWNTRIWK